MALARLLQSQGSIFLIGALMLWTKRRANHLVHVPPKSPVALPAGGIHTEEQNLAERQVDDLSEDEDRKETP